MSAAARAARPPRSGRLLAMILPQPRRRMAGSSCGTLRRRRLAVAAAVTAAAMIALAVCIVAAVNAFLPVREPFRLVAAGPHDGPVLLRAATTAEKSAPTVASPPVATETLPEAETFPLVGATETAAENVKGNGTVEDAEQNEEEEEEEAEEPGPYVTVVLGAQRLRVRLQQEGTTVDNLRTQVEAATQVPAARQTLRVAGQGEVFQETKGGVLLRDLGIAAPVGDEDVELGIVWVTDTRSPEELRKDKPGTQGFYKKDVFGLTPVQLIAGFVVTFFLGELWFSTQPLIDFFIRNQLPEMVVKEIPEDV